MKTYIKTVFIRNLMRICVVKLFRWTLLIAIVLIQYLQVLAKAELYGNII